MPALEEILQRHPVWRGAVCLRPSSVVPTGSEALDRELAGGWPTAGLTEILGRREGIGELELLAPALASLSQAGGRIVWLAPPHLPYAPALAAAGIDLRHLTVIRAPGRRDALWAAEQVLRAGPCQALVAWFPKARYEELRRLAVAAEGKRVLVALFRPSETAGEASPAGLRLALEALPGMLNIHFLKRRGAPLAAPIAVKRSLHALARTSFSSHCSSDARAHRRLGLPVHA